MSVKLGDDPVRSFRGVVDPQWSVTLTLTCDRVQRQDVVVRLYGLDDERVDAPDVVGLRKCR